MVVAAAALGGCGGGGARHDAAPAIDASVDAAMAACDPRPGVRIELVTVATGLDRPVGVTGPVGDRRIVVVEQGGLVRLVDDAGLAEAPYLDLRAAVIAEGERGLLGLAFHPRFGANGRLFVNFTRAPDGATVIAELTADPAATTVDAATRRDLLVIEQPFPQHNGGGLEFGPDGYLYVATGDGGSGGDPFGNGQRLTTHLGKVLRLDVDGADGARPYRIPADNPFATSPDGPDDPRPEIWHWGLRNPWRFTFDRATGDLYLGDVGQGRYEEIDYTPHRPAVNWGWDDREGAHCFTPPSTGCATADRTDPILERDHTTTGWTSIIGGQVYRGRCFPGLVGRYFFGDFTARALWSTRVVGGVATEERAEVADAGRITAIHADGVDELYLTTYEGVLARIEARP